MSGGKDRHCSRQPVPVPDTAEATFIVSKNGGFAK
jgi:hypothetical protein